MKIGLYQHLNCLRPAPAAVAVLILSIVIALPSVSRSPRKTHQVQSGESVAEIADYYGVSQRDLRELNKLGKKDALKVGKKLRIPNVLRVPGKPYQVKKNDTIKSIAKKHKRTVEEILEANKLKDGSNLQVGRTLVIPDPVSSGKQIKFKDKRPQPIVFLRVLTGESARLKLYYNNGKINRNSVNRLSQLTHPRHSKQRVKRLNSRLIEMIQRVAERFPGSAIEIISGYRPQVTGNETQHAFGRALDFRVDGVPLAKLFRFCKSLPRSGCGYYPRENFIHMDAREKRVSWAQRKKGAGKSGKPATTPATTPATAAAPSTKETAPSQSTK